MLGREDEAVIQADAYIDALLAAHGGLPAALPDAAAGPSEQLRRTIELLEARLPRFHPSFRFEEALAGRLRAAASMDSSAPRPPGSTIPQLPIDTRLPGLAENVMFDRRLLLGGAIASGVSLAGAAMFVRAQRRSGRARSRREWLS